eukprot:Nk52_evm26s123 gene=Nk52_evmTU26s123
MDAVLNKFLEHFMNDFIFYWFSSFSDDEEFPTQVRLCLSTVVMNFTSYLKTSSLDLISLLIFRAFHTFIVHLREYRKLEYSRLSIDEYLNGKGSHYLHFAAVSKENELVYLRQVSELLIMKLVPESELKAKLVKPILRELLACQLLLPAIQKVCDADFVNLSILSFFGKCDPTLAKPKFRVRICMSRNLVIDRIPEMSKTYFVLSINGKQQLWTPRMNFSKLNDIYLAYSFPFSVDLSDVVFRVDAHDWDPYNGDRYIGSTIISMRSVHVNRVYEKWFTLKSPPHPDGSKVGEVLLQFFLDPNEDSSQEYRNFAWPNVKNEHEQREVLDTSVADMKFGEGEDTGVAFDKLNGRLSDSLSNIKDAGTGEGKKKRPKTLSETLRSNTAFSYFMEFMEREGASFDLQFWVNADNYKRIMKSKIANGEDQTQEGREFCRQEAFSIYTLHFAPGAPCIVNLSKKDVLQNLEKAMRDSKQGPGPQCFQEAERLIYGRMENSYFPKFRKSELYSDMISDLKNDDEDVESGSESASASRGVSFDLDRENMGEILSVNVAVNNPLGESAHRGDKTEGKGDRDEVSNSGSLPGVSETSEESGELEVLGDEFDHPNNSDGGIDCPSRTPIGAAISLLREQQLVTQSRIEQALGKGDHVCAKNLRKASVDLEKQINEILALSEDPENDFTGEIEATVSGVEIVKNPKVKRYCVYIIDITRTDNNFSRSWRVERLYGHFAALNKELIKKFPKVKMLDFPKQMERIHAEEMRIGLNRYLQMLLSDELLRSCPSMRRFLAPHNFSNNRQITIDFNVNKLTSVPRSGSVDNSNVDLQNATTPIQAMLRKSEEKRANGKANTTVTSPKQTSKESSQRKSSDSLVHFMQEDSEILLDTFFALVDELFDLNNVNKWIRRQAIIILKQILQNQYGEAINKAIVDNVKRAVSMEAMCRYVEVLIDSMWPDGTWAEGKERTDERRQWAKIEAKKLLLNNFPENLQKIIGRFNSVCGINRMFNMLQQEKMNKHLLYVTLDTFLVALLSPKGIERGGEGNSKESSQKAPSSN